MRLFHFRTLRESVLSMWVNSLHTLLIENLYHPLENAKDSLCLNVKTAQANLFRWLITLKIVLFLNARLQDFLMKIIRMGPVPNHVSFIMDGNRRYAKSMEIPLKKGHEAGGIKLLSLVYACKRMGVKCVSAYAFSIENFNRPKEEVDVLNNLFADKLDEFSKRAQDYKDPLYGAKLRIIGDMSMVSEEMQTRISNAERFTEDGSGFVLYICFPYTSRNDICHAMYTSVEKSLSKEIVKENINIKSLTDTMYLEQFSDHCDLLIRTSGHRRLSDYMLWQSNECSTIEFSSCLWPDFSFLSMFFMILRWSFYTTLEKYSNSGNTLRQTIVKKSPNFLKIRKHTDFNNLPAPPIAISITGESG